MAGVRDSSWTTPVRQVLSGGRFVGVDNSMWVYRKVPLAPMVDAKTKGRIDAAAVPLMRFFEQLSGLAQTSGGRRALAKGSYREFHVVAVNVPMPFQAPRELANREMLEADYGDRFTFRRVVLAGVRLVPKMRRKGQGALASAVESLSQTIVRGGVPLEDYESDYETVDKVMRQCGLAELGVDEFGHDEVQLVQSWWNFGRSADTPIMVEADHVHVFRSVGAAKTAQNLDRDECESWDVPGAYPLTFVSVSEFDLPWVEATSRRALWCTDLMDSGARMVSMRGLVEPVKVTRGELARGRDRFMRDREERIAQGRAAKADQDQQIQVLSEVEAGYATGGGSPSVVGLSVVAAVEGVVHDVGRFLSDSAVILGALQFRQHQAFLESMPCSPMRAAPQLHDVPAQTVAYSGVTNLSTVGDRDGALLGFSEYDRQPVYVSPFAAMVGDAGPALLVAGATGSGKELSLDTVVCTPVGPVELRDVCVGTRVLGRDGRECTVTGVFDQVGTEMFEVALDDGQVVRAGRCHLWVVDGLSVNAGDVCVRLMERAGRCGGDLVDAEGVWRLVRGVGPWRSAWGVESSLLAVGVSGRVRACDGVRALAVRCGQWLGEGVVGSGELVLSTGEIRDFAVGGGIRLCEPCELDVSVAPGPSQRVAGLGERVECSSVGEAERVARVARSAGWKVRVRGCVVERLAGSRLLIVSVEPSSSERTRCLSVDSVDRTYLCAGFVPTHNTMTLLSLARQWARIPNKSGRVTPVVMVDPKQSSDGGFERPVRNLGGQVMSLDSLVSADGVFDPVRVLVDRSSRERFEATYSEAVELASDMISGIDPWPKDYRQGFEVALLKALRFGVVNGASCVGEALRMADRESPLPAGMVGPIMDTLEASPLARAVLGVEPGSASLRTADGLSLIMVGSTRIPLPDEGAWEQSSLVQRIGSWLLKMMVFGSASAVSYRGGGVVILDEAWQFLAGPTGAQEVQRLMRLARSQQVLVVLASQRVSDFVDANLVGGISRGLLLPLDRGTGAVDQFGRRDDGQAGFALDLFQVERTDERLRRMSGARTVEGSDLPNWDSMRSLRDPQSGEVVRGTVGLYSDLSGRVVPAEIVIPPAFLAEISTNISDVRARGGAVSMRGA